MKTCVSPPTEWSDSLQQRAAGGAERVAHGAPALFDAMRNEFADRLERVCAVSDFVAGVLVRQPDAMHAALDAGRLHTPDAPKVTALSGEPAAAMRDLREQRDRELALIAWHDLVGQRDTVATLAALSELADRCLRVACDGVRRVDERKYGAGLAPPLVIAMGKLGGGELNFSSDVDLVFLHPDDPAQQARYLRMARELIRWLDEPTSAGRVYRVDVRLRPFGGTGALSLSLNAFERYLQVHARDWERYAYVKARVLTGDGADQERFNGLRDAFVYRRYLDFGVFDALRDTKSAIEADVLARDQSRDIKRGAGGIREIEFVAQAFQLLRGGRQRALQTPSLREALAHIAAAGHLPAATVTTLLESYDFLRHIENRLQMRADQQTHELPDAALDREQLGASVGMTAADLDAAVDQCRSEVKRVFSALLAPDEPAEPDTMSATLWKRAQDKTKLAELLGGDGDAFAGALHDLAVSRVLGKLDAASRKRLDRLVPGLIAAAQATANPPRTLTRLTRVLEGVGRRSAYFALLNENPLARERLVELCATSASVARDVAEHPLLLDSLIGLDVDDLPDANGRRQQLDSALHDIDPGDLDAFTDALAQFKSGAQFEVAVADLSSLLPVMKVSDQLTAIAQCVLESVLRAASRDIRARYGSLPEPGGEFCIVAYGKLGGIELGYGSDLDLVFLYDGPDGVTADDEPVSDGPRALPTPMYYARLVQRVVHMATATTRAGALYDVDMRLRPSGNSGPLVSRLAAYDNYQRRRAWTWEHQALLRARPVAGDDGLAQRFAILRRDVLCRQREPSTLRDDVLTMRKRMARAKPPRAGHFHIKHDPGGLTDVEFIVQHCLLAYAATHPELVEHSDHVRHLDALIAAQCLGAQVGEDLKAIYLDYRTHLHRRALDDGAAPVPEAEFASHRERVRGIWANLLE